MGNWFQHMLGKDRGAATAKPQVGMRILTADDVLLGTVETIWRGSDAKDHMPHPDTLGVRQLDPDDMDLLYIPADLVDRISARDILLRVDTTQIKNRGCRFRPEWLAPDPVTAQ
jgi:hypothetical protein